MTEKYYGKPIHLYDKELLKLDILKAMCGETKITPGFNAVAASPEHRKIITLTYCDKCFKSDDYAMWTLATLGDTSTFL